MSMPLAGKVALITGGARGQGRSHAVRLAELGADIVAFDICEQLDSVGYAMSTTDDLRETVGMVEALDRRCLAEVGDVRDRAALDTTVTKAIAEFGRIDFVVANAGIMPTHGATSDTMDAWHDCIEVMLTGTLHTIEATYPRLIEQGEGGSIVIISSMAAVQPMLRTLGAKTLGLLAYCAAKAGVADLGKSYASVLATHNIRVNWIHPAGVATPMVENPITASYFAEADPQDLLALVPAMPVGMLDPSDVSALVAWMCSPESRWFTGNGVRLDGGAFLR